MEPIILCGGPFLFFLLSFVEEKAVLFHPLVFSDLIEYC
jgi:hypothetical protein